MQNQLRGPTPAPTRGNHAGHWIPALTPALTPAPTSGTDAGKTPKINKGAGKNKLTNVFLYFSWVPIGPILMGFWGAVEGNTDRKQVPRNGNVFSFCFAGALAEGALELSAKP